MTKEALEDRAISWSRNRLIGQNFEVRDEDGNFILTNSNSMAYGTRRFIIYVDKINFNYNNLIYSTNTENE